MSKFEGPYSRRKLRGSATPPGWPVGTDQEELLSRDLPKVYEAWKEDAVATLVFAGQQHAVVVRIRDVLTHVDGGKGLVRKELDIGSQAAAPGGIVDRDKGLVEVDVEQEFVPARALIIGFKGEVLAHAALNTEVVLIDVRAAEIGILRTEADEAAGGCAWSLTTVV